VVVLGALSSLAPVHTLAMFVVGLVQSYVVEEWVHHSVHFYNFNSRYFRYIRRMHLFHHSRWGAQGAFGLTSDLWDVVYGTRPTRERGAGSGPRATA
jgi:sterol desaturase/sphingolipid hydroxylase (fatty acid hydroxylase superfamily)